MSNTRAAGAVIERALIQRYLKRLKESVIEGPTISPGETIGRIQKWLRDQPLRTRRKGGIGRR
jgi:hypothetical protein